MALLSVAWQTARAFHPFIYMLCLPFLACLIYRSVQLGCACCRYTNLAGQAGNRPQDVYEPTLGRIIPYQICIAFIGIFMVMIIKKVGAGGYMTIA